MPRRFYFDTSVFGGVFDDEFRDDSIQLFEQVKRGRVVCLYSKNVEEELKGAPTNVLSLFRTLPAEYVEEVKMSRKAKELAEEYIREKVVGSTSREDCIHIALATVNSADAIISWNFKHIVNTTRIKGYNSVNLNLGYNEIKIYSPKQLRRYEE